MTKQVRADLMLVLVTLCWGVSYYLMDLSLEDLEPFTLNAFRFLGAFFIASIVAFPKLKSVNRTTLKYSLFVGLALLFVYIGATFGVMYTSLSNSGFLCALTVVFTPIFAFLFKKQIPDKKLAIVVIMCIAGIGLLTLNEQLKPALGDILCIMCAVAYAIDLLLTETAVAKEEVDAFQLGVFQLGFTGLFNLILALLLEEPHFPGSGAVWGSVFFLSVFCTGVAFIVQAIAQQYTTASHVGVIFTLEPVFAGIVAFIFAGEVLLPRAYVGAVILIASLFVMELDVKTLFKRNAVRQTFEEPQDMKKSHFSLKRIWNVWKGLNKDIKFSKSDAPARWALELLVMVLLVVMFSFTTGSKNGYPFIVWAVPMFWAYKAHCNWQGSIAAVSTDYKLHVKYIYQFFVVWEIILLLPILVLSAITGAVSHSEPPDMYLYSNLYILLMTLGVLLASMPLIFIRSTKLWWKWALGTMTVFAVFHLCAWQNMRGEAFFTFRDGIAFQPAGMAWMAAALILAVAGAVAGYKKSLYCTWLQCEEKDNVNSEI